MLLSVTMAFAASQLEEIVGRSQNERVIFRQLKCLNDVVGLDEESSSLSLVTSGGIVVVCNESSPAAPVAIVTIQA
jgi:hypothetical protein